MHNATEMNSLFMLHEAKTQLPVCLFCMEYRWADKLYKFVDIQSLFWYRLLMFCQPLLPLPLYQSIKVV